MTTKDMTEDTTRSMTGSTWKEIVAEAPRLLRLAWPIVIGQIGQMMFGFIDSMMIGRVSTIALAASAFGNSVFVIFLIFGLGVSNSTSPLVSRALGRGDQVGALRILKDALLLNVGLGVFLTLGALACLPFFDRMGQTPEVAAEAAKYVFVVALSLAPANAFQVYKQFLESTGHAKTPMIATVGGLLCNVILNFCLIYGVGPIPSLGLLGAAIATLISRVLMLLVLLPVVRAVRESLAQSPHSRTDEKSFRDFSIMKELLALGVPSGFVLLFEVGAFASAALMMGWVGSIELAAHQVALSLASLSFMVPLGISFASGIRVGFEAGRQDFSQARIAGLTGILAAGCFMAVMALVFSLGRHLFPALFTSDSAVLDWAARMLVVVALFQLFDGVQCVCVSNLRALHDVRWPLAITLLAYWVVALPGGYAMTFKLGVGPLGIWLGLFGGLFVAALLLCGRFLILVRRLRKSSQGETFRVPTQVGSESGKSGK